MRAEALGGLGNDNVCLGAMDCEERFLHLHERYCRQTASVCSLSFRCEPKSVLFSENAFILEMYTVSKSEFRMFFASNVMSVESSNVC